MKSDAERNERKNNPVKRVPLGWNINRMAISRVREIRRTTTPMKNMKIAKRINPLTNRACVRLFAAEQYPFFHSVHMCHFIVIFVLRCSKIECK